MQRKKPLTRNSKIILADLFRAKRSLSVRQISQRNKIAWKTAKENIERLEKRGLVDCKQQKGEKGQLGKRSCKINPNARKILEK